MDWTNCEGVEEAEERSSGSSGSPSLLRVVIVLVVVFAVAATLAAAANLTVATGSLGAGATTIEPCDQGSFEYSNTVVLGVVTAVEVTGIGSGCAGTTLNLSLDDAEDSSIGSGEAELDGDPTAIVAIVGAPDPGDVTSYTATVTRAVTISLT
ncbi:MAG TPA: hypothetical protein VG652_03115 [Gaiellaceae bacterium]|nr:hypothetical protein [Gaiellaceae bacterium]